MLHVVIGAAVGALVGGAASAVGSLARGKPIDWKSVGAAALGGAAAGSIASLTFGAGLLAGSAAAQVTGMTVAGAAGGASETLADNLLHKREWHQDLARNTAIGAAIGGVAGGIRVAAKPVATAIARHGPRLLQGARTGAQRLVKFLQDPKVRKTLQQVARSPAARKVLRAIGNTPAGRTIQRSVLRPLARLWGSYTRALEINPVRTKSATSSVIAMTGDAISQLMEEDRTEWDWRRTLFRGAYAAAVSAPLGHRWYNFLDKVIPGKGVGAIFGKTAVDQLLFQPVSASLFFGSYSTVYQGKSPGEALESIKEDAPAAVTAGWTVWPAIHLLNFRTVPLKFRVPFNNAVGLGWSVFFSSLLGDSDEEQPTAGTPRQLPRPVDMPLGEPSAPTVGTITVTDPSRTRTSYFGERFGGGEDEGQGRPIEATPGLVEALRGRR